ncbi:hypothetical protein ACFL0D_05615 [Thermoproteota archaeon]
MSETVTKLEVQSILNEFYKIVVFSSVFALEHTFNLEKETAISSRELNVFIQKVRV